MPSASQLTLSVLCSARTWCTRSLSCGSRLRRMKELRHCSWVKGCGWPRRDTPPCLSPRTIPSSAPSLLSVGEGSRMRVCPSPPQLSISAPNPSTAPVGRPKEVCGLPCVGVAAGDVSPWSGLQAWAGLGCGQGRRRGRYQSEFHTLLFTLHQSATHRG